MEKILKSLANDFESMVCPFDDEDAAEVILKMTENILGCRIGLAVDKGEVRRLVKF